LRTDDVAQFDCLKVKVLLFIVQVKGILILNDFEPHSGTTNVSIPLTKQTLKPFLTSHASILAKINPFLSEMQNPLFTFWHSMGIFEIGVSGSGLKVGPVKSPIRSFFLLSQPAKAIQKNYFFHGFYPPH